MPGCQLHIPGLFLSHCSASAVLKWEHCTCEFCGGCSCLPKPPFSFFAWLTLTGSSRLMTVILPWSLFFHMKENIPTKYYTHWNQTMAKRRCISSSENTTRGKIQRQKGRVETHRTWAGLWKSGSHFIFSPDSAALQVPAPYFSFCLYQSPWLTHLAQSPAWSLSAALSTSWVFGSVWLQNSQANLRWSFSLRKPRSQQNQWMGWISARHLSNHLWSEEQGHVLGYVGLSLLVAFRKIGFLKWTTGGMSNDGQKDDDPPIRTLLWAPSTLSCPFLALSVLYYTSLWTYVLVSTLG